MLDFVQRGGRGITALKAIFNASRTMGVMPVVDKLGDYLDKVEDFNEAVSREYPMMGRVFAEMAVHGLIDAEEKPTGWSDYFKIIHDALGRSEKVAMALKDEEHMQSFGRIKYGVQLMEQYYQKQDARMKDVLNACIAIDSVDTEIFHLLPEGQHIMVHDGVVFTLNR